MRKWVNQFNNERTKVYDKARSGRPSVVHDLVEQEKEKIDENRLSL